MTPSQIRQRLRDWLEANVEGWSDVQIQPLEVTTGSGFSALPIFGSMNLTTS